jgi:hypothetical protein
VAPVPPRGIRSYTTRDESTSTLTQLGKPALDLPATAHVVRTAVLQERPGRAGASRQIVWQEPQFQSLTPDAVVEWPPGLDATLPITVQVGPQGNLAKVWWPAAWAHAGLAEAAYDLNLTLLFPVPGEAEVHRMIHEQVLGRPLLWTLREEWRTVSQSGTMVTLHYESSGTTTGGRRLASGQVRFDSSTRQVMQAEATESTHLRLPWSKHLTIDQTVVRWIVIRPHSVGG